MNKYSWEFVGYGGTITQLTTGRTVWLQGDDAYYMEDELAIARRKDEDEPSDICRFDLLCEEYFE